MLMFPKSPSTSANNEYVIIQVRMQSVQPIAHMSKNSKSLRNIRGELMSRLMPRANHAEDAARPLMLLGS